MTEHGDQFERPHPIGWVTSGQSGEIPGAAGASENPVLGSPPEANTETTLAGPPKRNRRRQALVASAVAVIALGTGAAGAVVGHELWTSAPAVQSAAPSGGSFNNPAGSGSFNTSNPFSGFGNGSGAAANSSSAATNSSAAGSPANATSIATKVDPALVDINSTFSYQSEAGAGTGIVLSANGEVVTNNHVIDGATKISVTDLGNGKTYSATVVGYDPTADLAVLQLQGASGLKTASIGDSSKLTVDTPVVGIGNAGGAGGTPSTAAGEVTALHQAITAGDDLDASSEQLSGLIETNADIQPGDSGGPLVNAAGQVVGIDVAGSEGVSFQTASGQGYAIPIDQAITTAQQIEAGTSSTDVHVGPTAFLGILGSASGTSTPTTIPVPSGNGSGGIGFGFGVGSGATGGSSTTTTTPSATISEVVSGQAAAKAGLAAGDTITTFNGQKVSSWTALSKLMLAEHPGDKVTIGFTTSSGAAQTVTVDLGSGPPS